jgi:hypothetical protein
MSRIMRARTTVWLASPDGGPARLVRIGDLASEDDPIVAVAPGLFESVDSIIEQASAAPGEKRARRSRT